MIFALEDMRATAARELAPAPPATVGEALVTSFETTQATETVSGLYFGLRDAYAEYLHGIERDTGQKFTNPLDVTSRFGDFDSALGSRRAQAQAEAELYAELQKLSAAGAGFTLMSPSQIREVVAQRRAAARQERADVEARSLGLASVAGFVGTAGGVLMDPYTVASMSFGAPWSAGILRAAAIDAGIAVGSESLLQASLQAGRIDVGEAPSFREAALNVAAAGAGTFVLSGLLRAGLKATRALLDQAKQLRTRPAEVRAAEAFLTREVELRETSPFEDTPAGWREHEARMTEAQRAIAEDRPPAMPDRPAARVVAAEASEAPAAPLFEASTPEAELASVGARMREEIAAREAATETAGGSRIGPEPGAGALDDGGFTPSPVAERRPPVRPTEDPDIAADLADDDLLAEVRRAYSGREDETIYLEDEAGIVRPTTVRKLLEEIDDDRAIADAFAECVRGVAA